MSIYTFFVLQPYAFLAHNIHITDINNSEYNIYIYGVCVCMVECCDKHNKDNEIGADESMYNSKNMFYQE